MEYVTHADAYSGKGLGNVRPLARLLLEGSAILSEDSEGTIQKPWKTTPNHWFILVSDRLGAG
jgi:hypothetical protein